jgi:hypothetical protein
MVVSRLVRDAVLKPCAPPPHLCGRMLSKESRLSSGILRLPCLPLGNVSCCVHGVLAFLALYWPSWSFFYMINTPSRVYS